MTTSNIIDLVKGDDWFGMITYDGETRSVAKEQLGKEPQKHSSDFFVLYNKRCNVISQK